MNATTILIMQSFLVFMQMANAAVDTLPQPWPVLVSAFIGAFQYLVNHLGNGLTPPAALPKPVVPPAQDKTTLTVSEERITTPAPKKDPTK